MEKQKKKLTILANTALVITLFMSGCGNTTEDASVDNQDTQVITEITGTEIETEIVADTEERTEVAVEEEKETEEDDVIAIGFSKGQFSVVNQPSEIEYIFIGEIQEGDKVKIIGEFYNEDEQVDFYKIRFGDGEEGYIEKKCIQLEE